ncbi:uncharacterized protein BKA55DRAFT_549003 [Fusarium redolens]|uniref:Uncharacterized protein n=1 Tax=Fusarium redolens TaxID=48865 RepID=A0A9P9KW08_FUSRE|nr:uncharacterized protein BKA55DRAFT_549003 [Fusarium redolens]KAH7269579.1 hypothetical protein BKA55DRAFT_549003 [Fusarium redolens]
MISHRCLTERIFLRKRNDSNKPRRVCTTECSCDPILYQAFTPTGFNSAGHFGKVGGSFFQLSGS